MKTEIEDLINHCETYNKLPFEAWLSKCLKATVFIMFDTGGHRCFDFDTKQTAIIFLATISLLYGIKTNA